MRMPGEKTSPDTWEEQWSPIDGRQDRAPSEGQPYKPEPVKPPDERVNEGVNPFQQFVGQPAPAAQRVEAHASLSDRFTQHWINAMYGGTAGIVDAAEIKLAEDDPAQHAKLLAERDWRQQQYEGMPPAETGLEAFVATLGELGGGASDPLSAVPVGRLGGAAWHTANPIISRIIDQGVSGAVMNGVANTALQALEYSADLRDQFDPREALLQTAIGLGAGGVFGLGEGAIAKEAANSETLTKGLLGAPEPGKAASAPPRGRPALGVEFATGEKFPPQPFEPKAVTDFTTFLENKGITPDKFDAIKDGEEGKALYNEYLGQASQEAQGAASEAARPEDLMTQYGPERLNAAQEALFGEVVGTRNLTPEQNTQLQDHLAGTQPATERTAEGHPDILVLQERFLKERGITLDEAAKLPLDERRQIERDFNRWVAKDGQPATERADGKKTIGVNSKGQTVVEYKDGRRGVYDKDGNLTIETPNLLLQKGGAERADGGAVREPQYVVTDPLDMQGGEIFDVDTGRMEPVGKGIPVFEGNKEGDITLGSEYRQFRPDELKVDAKRFQFKEGGDAAGVTDRLKGVKKWDPTKAGQTLVWESKEGEFFIADGHQRHGLATKMAAEGQNVTIPAYVLREADGITAEDARILAAAKNIAEGTGSAIDAAKILRTRPDMGVNLPPSSALVRDAEGLARLSDDAFGMVINKKVPAGYAAIVGKLAPDQGTHADLLAMLAKEQPDNAIEAESMVRDALEAPSVQSTMEDMFGSSAVTQILFKERAQILSAAASTIRKDKAAFATLVREEERISGAGNKLATATNQERASQDAALLATIQAAARRKGPVADALAAGAKRLKDGESKSAVVRDFIDALRTEARSIIPGGGRSGGAGSAEQGIAASLTFTHEWSLTASDGKTVSGKSGSKELARKAAAMWAKRIRDSGLEVVSQEVREITPKIAQSGVRRNTDSAAFQKWFGDSKVVDEKGEPAVLYHGSHRIDRIVGRGKFDAKRATSGPMAFLTDNPELATSYAMGKKGDTSLAGEEHYAERFTVKIRGKPRRIDQIWWDLSDEERQRISELAPRVARDDNYDIALEPKGHTRGIGNYDMELTAAHGNHLRALTDSWLMSGAIFGKEEEFLKVLKLAGLKTPVEYFDPDFGAPGVIPVFASIKNPLDTANIPANVVEALREAAKGKRASKGFAVDQWDKRTTDPREWLRRLDEAMIPGSNSFAFTVIPDWVTDTLKQLGYDGVKDIGGKMGGEHHTVWVPFSETQVKSIHNRGTFDPTDPRIAFSPQRQGGPGLLDWVSPERKAAAEAFAADLEATTKAVQGLPPAEQQRLSAEFHKRHGITSFEPGAEGKPQGVIPGTERATPKTMAERQAAAPMRASKPQRSLDFGLFGDEPNQLDLVDLSRVPKIMRQDADYLDLTPSGSSKSIQLGDTSIQYAAKDGEVEIIAVRTPPQLRNQGKAREALMAFLEQVDDAGLPVRAYSTPLDRATNPAGVIRFYESLGFSSTGRKINKAGDIEMLRSGPPPEIAELRSLVGNGDLIPLADYTDPAMARHVAEAYIGTQPARTFDDLYGGRGDLWQRKLAETGAEIQAATGARVSDPGLKKRADAEAKINRKGYDTTRQVTDVVRLGFVVNSPDQAQRAVNMLAAKYRMLDEGWKLNDVNYFDRKALVQFADGTIGEVQFWEPRLIAAKNSTGHGLYEKARKLPPGDPGRAALEDQQRDLYSTVVSTLDPVWASVIGRSGKSGDVLENAIRMSSSEASGVPESMTSAESAGFHSAPARGTNQANPPSMTAGRPSQSKNRMGGDIAAKLRPAQQSPVPTNRAQSGTAGTAAPAERLEAISADLAKLVGFKVPVRQGRLAKFKGGKAAGQYDRSQGVIRMAEMSDFETQTHETAHALETEYGRDLSTLKGPHVAELDAMAYPGADPKMITSEGFAEFVRFYVSNPLYAQRQAPGFYSAFEGFLRQKNPEQFARLQNIRDRYVAWQYTPSAPAVAADIVSARRNGVLSDSISEMRKNGIGLTIGSYFDKLYTRTMDKTHPINRMVDELKKVYEQRTGNALDLKAAEDPHKLARLFPDAQSRGHMDIMHGVMRHGSTQRDGPGLSDGLEVALGSQWQSWSDESLQDFAAYLVSRRAIQEYERYFNGDIPNVPGKFTLGDYQVAKDEFEQLHPEWTQAADMIYQWNRNLLRKKREAGFLDEATYRELLTREDYVPFQRDLTDIDKEALGGPPTGRTLRDSIFKSFRGSKRSVINPIESMAKDAYDTNMLIAQNDIAKAIEDLGRMVGVGAGAFVERIPDKSLKGTKVDVQEVLKQAAKDAGLNPTDVDQLTTTVGNMLGDDAKATVFRWTDINEKGEPIIYVWRDGKRGALRLADGDFGKEVYQSLTGLNKEMQGMWTAIASLPSTAVRYGITTAPHFVIANYIRDQISAWVLTGDGFIPFISGATGLRDEITQAEVTRLYNSFGGIMGGGNVASLDRARASRDIRALQKKGYALKRFASIRGFAELTELTETGTRLALFKNAFERARREGLNDYEAAVEAGYTSRDYIDFGRHGSKMLAARRLVPFLNASLQGLDKTLRTTITPWVKLRTGRPLSASDKRNLATSAKAWMKMTAVGMFGLGLSYIYKDDPEYEEISDYLKASHWMVKYGDGKWAAIPKPFELGFVSNLFERSFEAIYKQDPSAMGRFMDGLYQITAPPFLGPLLQGDIKGALKDIPIIGEGAAIATNTDLYTGRPIIPDNQLGLEPALQYTAYTSELARQLGGAVNVSPAIIDHAISGFGGSWGSMIERFSTDVANDQGLVTATANTVAHRFIREAVRGGTSSRQFWNMVGETTGTYARVSNTYANLLKNAGTAESDAYVDRMGEDERAYALLNGNFPAEAKRLHPLNRAQDAIQAISQIRKEIAGNNLTRQEDKKQAFEDREKIVLTPSQRQTAQDILGKIEMVEARNALITLKTPGWAQREPMDLDSLHRDLALALPDIEEEVLARFAKNHVYDAQAVADSWPDTKQRILEDRQDANFNDLIAGAK